MTSQACTFVGTFLGVPQQCGEPPESQWHDPMNAFYKHPYKTKRPDPVHFDPIDLDLRSSALLVYLTYIEEKRRLRPTDIVADTGYLDAIYEVRRYVTELVAERVAS